MTSDPSDFDARLAVYLEALLARDRRSAVRLVVAMVEEEGWSPVDVACELIVAAQREIGERWMRDEITVADEHVATSITEFVVANLVDRVDPDTSDDAPVVLLATPDGEQHAMGVRIAELALREAGADVHWVGASVPAADLAALAVETGADWVGLGASVATHVPSLVVTIDQLRELVPGIRIAVGGPASSAVEVTAEVAARADVVVGDPRTFAAELTGRSTP